MAELIKSVKALGEAITGEKIEGDTLFEAVKDAGEKMTGKELEGKELNDIIAETAEEYEGGGAGGGWVPVKNRSSLTVHCLAIKQLLIDNNIDIEASAAGDVYINIGATISKEYAPGGAHSIQIRVRWNSDTNFQGILDGQEIDTTTWDVTEDQSVTPTVNELLTKGGDVKTYFNIWPEGYVSFYLNLSIGYISSGYWLEIPSGDVSKYFEIGEPEE